MVYRRIGKNSHDPMPPVAMLNQVCERVVGALGGVGVRCTRMNGLQVHGWLLRLFNPCGVGGQGHSVPSGYSRGTAGDPGGHDAGDDRLCGKSLVHAAGVGSGKRRVVAGRASACRRGGGEIAYTPEAGTLTGEKARVKRR